ncbi:MAG: flagellar FlbD family protein [Chloroflexi bacterium]|nr:flagellar FlbD family protein [Chloroflexota bacterium]
MILVSRLNGSQFYVNAELIQSVESTPDTVITLTNNVIVIVKDPAEQVVKRIVAYQRQVRSGRMSDEEAMQGSGA